MSPPRTVSGSNTVLRGLCHRLSIYGALLTAARWISPMFGFPTATTSEDHPSLHTTLADSPRAGTSSSQPFDDPSEQPLLARLVSPLIGWNVGAVVVFGVRLGHRRLLTVHGF